MPLLATHRSTRWHCSRAALAMLLALFLLVCPPPATSYAVLAHQALIDAAWETHLKPTLHRRFPKATEEELSAAQAYAYGGAIIQDMGYYPHGSPFFSDLTHYVRSGDFIRALLDDSQDVYEYAFALGALSHYSTDNDGHRIGTNRAVPILYPKLRKKFGEQVTYEDDPLAHVKTEFGFDVLQVAQGRYAPDSYHDFIGFEVSRTLLESAFRETYGLELSSVLRNEDKALNSYRHDVSKIIPEATKIAWNLKGKEIRADEPSATERKFLYNLSRSNYEKEWGKEYVQLTAKEKFLAFLYKLVPKIGPLRVLQLRTPTPETEKLFEASFNASLDEYRKLLIAEQQNHLVLPNTNFDVGTESVRGIYKLNDDARAKLLHQLAAANFQSASPELRKELAVFFAGPLPVPANPAEAKSRAQIEAELAAMDRAPIPEKHEKSANFSTIGKQPTQ